MMIHRSLESTNLIKPTTLMLLAFAATTTAATAEEVSPECRGVAAGTVASMRAAGELPTQEAVEAAVLAARRACAASTQELGGGAAGTGDGAGAANAGAGAAAAATAPATQAAKADDEPSIWDLLTRDRDRKPGNERLRRLKTQ
jgi:hypothetical protein